MFKDYDKKRIWVDGKGNVFKLVVDKDPDGEESKLHTDKFKTRLCIDCAETILDDDGKVIGHYVEKECGFIEVKPIGRKKERCEVCERKHRKKYHKGYQKEKRAEARKERAKKTPPMRWPDCPQYDECLTEAAIASKDLSCESCETYLTSHPVNKNR